MDWISGYIDELNVDMLGLSGHIRYLDGQKDCGKLDMTWATGIRTVGM
ncbi:hypothetical protein [Aquibacillus rhizosphaerae]|uniref:Uncharacterized protein n=1 Tax=Aquibacillus rhizosphaerae TaxID=3051431 RepID=A0ABT7KZJ0_9BACI|nr:hypothetical protein [Aquibacillus sp. LR5S19]MDL4838947.1 hypothetical protein [Aquibacillus sp. LR5S19]